MSDNSRDVGDNINSKRAGWSFTGIAGEFDEHVKKSVPLYEEGHDLICQLSDFFLADDSLVVELGMSTGALAERFLAHHADRSGLRYVGIDCEPSMVEKAAERCKNEPRASFVIDDIMLAPIEPCSMIVSYYTIQFVHPRLRQELLTKIYDTLEWGGAFVLFEKVRAPDARFQDIAVQIYQEHKLKMNFTETQILQKQRSLKGVLEPFSTQGNLDLMKRAGFVDMMTVMKWNCFEGFLAIK